MTSLFLLPFSLTQEKLLDTSLPPACTFISFNPGDRDHLMGGGLGGLYFFRVTKLLETNSVNVTKVDIGGREEGRNGDGGSSSSSSSSSNSNAGVTACCWGLEGKAYVGTTAGEILVVNSDNGEVVSRMSVARPQSSSSSSSSQPSQQQQLRKDEEEEGGEMGDKDHSSSSSSSSSSSPSISPPKIVGLVLTLSHIISATDNGVISWHNLKNWGQVDKTVVLPPLPSTTQVGVVT